MPRVKPAQPAVTATAAAGGLSIEASGGTGAVAIGPYGTNLEGPALAGHKGAYFLIDASEGLNVHGVEYTDCELAGARTLWWDDPATGWETINQPTAVYDESTHCITVTATANSHPSIAQLSDAPSSRWCDRERGIRQMCARRPRPLRRRRLHERRLQGKERGQNLQGKPRMAPGSE